MVSSSGSNMTQSREGLPPEAQNESERCVTSEMTPKKPKWLPEDWEMEVRTRRSGKSAGMKDRVIKSLYFFPFVTFSCIKILGF